MAPGRDKTELLPTMTVRDIEIAVYGWRAVGDDGKMDYTKLAQMCKFGSIASARTCWSSVKKKLNALEPLSGGTTSAATAAAAPNKGKAATSKKREAASSTAAADIKHELLQSDEYVDLAVTGKKTRPGPKKAQVVKDEDQVDGDGAETSSIKDSSE